MSEQLEAYCVKCKAKRPMAETQPVFTKTGTPATRGVCSVCGTNLYRMGETAAHEGMERPEPVAPKRKKKKKSSNGTGRRGRLVIVESPAKAKTIGKYLGRGYTVKASVGHIRDLLKTKLSVDVDNDFEPQYRVPNEKRDVVKDLKKAAARAKDIYLATDPDREGEAIAWHLLEAAEIEAERAHRVVFYEITQDAVQEAFENPREIDQHLVDAQQARRILDRLVGYELSPLLWEKIRPRLSAGRVQSVAVRLIVEREREIDNFVPVEYWSIEADLAREDEAGFDDRIVFRAKLHKIAGEDVDLPDEDTVRPIVADLEQSEYIVSDVKHGTRRRNPSAPFTTSTLQQEASRRINFNARKTMRIAQQLYEGIELADGETVGLITYMRTDSTNISAQAQAEAAALIRETYGGEYLPKTPNTYSTKAKSAQEAHEAIRPTSVWRTPDDVKEYLSRDQRRLYTLIWQRFVASQMAPAVYNTLRVDIVAGLPSTPFEQRPYLFRATGSSIRFMGFLAVYADYSDEDNPDDDDLDRVFPELTVDDVLDLIELFPQQHFTQPPPRYSEATLVKTLEEMGIGRPSTYAPIINTIQHRGYVERDGKRLVPTETGTIVNDLLVEHFEEVVDYNFTAHMEEDLDRIASGQQDWVPIIREFYVPFKEEVEWARENVPNIDLDVEVGRECPECGNALIIRWGRYGKFIGCSNFPECRYTEPWLEYIGVSCPCDKGGEIVEKKTRRGRTFYGCSNYPECEWTSWKRPLPDPCPVCGGYLVRKNKDWAKCLDCESETELSRLPSVEAEGV
ncbi:MAG: type I DNA topoisomerase [Chloroflexi bacterium]|nr:type I DNA topoisomerase [Chloroflexota bacterium]